jgi:hypothetical protein
MKKIYFVIFMVVFSITAMATTEEEVLSKAPSAVKEQLRESLKSGLNNTEILNVYGMLIQSRYSYEEQKKIMSSMMEAYKKGVPSDAIANKIGEGLAKNVSAEMMEKAMNNVAHRYTVAKQIVEKVKAEEKVRSIIRNNISESMAAGFTEKDALSLMSKDRIWQNKELALEISEMVKDMVRARVSSEETAKTIGLAVDKGYSAREIKEIRNMFRENIRNMSAKQLVYNLRNGIENGYKGSEMQGSMTGGSRGGYGGGSAGSGGGSGSGGGAGGGSGSGSGGSGGGHGGGGKGR